MNIKKRESFIILGIACILMVIFAFSDLAITQAIYHPDSLYGYILQIFGELPSSITAVLGAATLITFMDRRNKGSSILKTIGLSLVILIGSSMGCLMPTAYAGIENQYIGLILMVLMVVVAFWLVQKIPMDKREQARKIACMGLWLFLFSLLSFNVIKMCWGRMRFVYMDNPLVQFSPWYLRQGMAESNTFMSFPSGHSAQASFILMLTLMPLVFTSLKKHQTLLCVIAFTWIVLVCSSRVIVGMHFSSDVTMGFIITFILFSLLKNFYLKPRIPELQDEDKE